MMTKIFNFLRWCLLLPVAGGVWAMFALLVLRLVFAQLYDINQIYRFNFDLYYSTTFTIVLVGVISIVMLFVQFYLTRAIAPRFKTKLAVSAVLLSCAAQAYMIYKIGVFFGLL